MQNRNLTRGQYGELSVKERTIYVINDHIDDWFQALVDDEARKELEKLSKKKRHK